MSLIASLASRTDEPTGAGWRSDAMRHARHGSRQRSQRGVLGSGDAAMSRPPYRTGRRARRRYLSTNSIYSTGR
eukprot:353279-Pleurochrysis_carterae.AAC.1